MKEGDKIVCTSLQDLLEIMNACREKGGMMILDPVDCRTLICIKSPEETEKPMST